jgi:hypothetical protein
MTLFRSGLLQSCQLFLKCACFGLSRLIQSYVDRYNTVRLHSAIGYLTPQDMLAGRQAEIHAARDRKLEEARRQRQLRRQQATPLRFAGFGSAGTMTLPGETEAGTAGTQPC